MKPMDMVSLTKPRITLLNIVTAVAAYYLGGGGAEGVVPLVVAGYLAAGGAGVVNQYMDRDIDAAMPRTRRRPIPSGRVSPQRAVIFGSILIAASLAISLATLNILAAVFIGLGIFIYLFVYTAWLKRRTPLNIVIGGAAGSCSPLAGWAAATGGIGLVAILIALLIFLWTPGHFWGLAIRAEKEYSLAGLPMLPSVAGIEAAGRWAGISNLVTATGWAALGLLLPYPLLYFAITSPLTVLLVIQSLKLMSRPGAPAAWAVFKTSSLWLGIVMLGAAASAPLPLG